MLPGETGHDTLLQHLVNVKKALPAEEGPFLLLVSE
jgi:hypothetical protein